VYFVEAGVRRSTRQRKLTYDNLTSSWIMGTQHLRGYPSYRGGDSLPPAPDACQTRSRERVQLQARTRDSASRGEEEQAPPTSPVLKQASPVLRDRRKAVKAETKDGDDNEAEAGDEEEPEEGEDKAASSADDNEAKPEGEEAEQKRNANPPINDVSVARVNNPEYLQSDRFCSLTILYHL